MDGGPALGGLAAAGGSPPPGPRFQPALPPHVALNARGEGTSPAASGGASPTYEVLWEAGRCGVCGTGEGDATHVAAGEPVLRCSVCRTCAHPLCCGVPPPFPPGGEWRCPSCSLATSRADPGCICPLCGRRHGGRVWVQAMYRSEQRWVHAGCLSASNATYDYGYRHLMRGATIAEAPEQPLQRAPVCLGCAESGVAHPMVVATACQQGQQRGVVYHFSCALLIGRARAGVLQRAAECCVLDYPFTEACSMLSVGAAPSDAARLQSITAAIRSTFARHALAQLELPPGPTEAGARAPPPPPPLKLLPAGSSREELLAAATAILQRAQSRDGFEEVMAQLRIGSSPRFRYSLQCDGDCGEHLTPPPDISYIALGNAAGTLGQIVPPEGVDRYPDADPVMRNNLHRSHVLFEWGGAAAVAEGAEGGAAGGDGGDVLVTARRAAPLVPGITIADVYEIYLADFRDEFAPQKAMLQRKEAMTIDDAVLIRQARDAVSGHRRATH